MPELKTAELRISASADVADKQCARFPACAFGVREGAFGKSRELSPSQQPPFSPIATDKSFWLHSQLSTCKWRAKPLRGTRVHFATVFSGLGRRSGLRPARTFPCYFGHIGLNALALTDRSREALRPAKDGGKAKFSPEQQEEARNAMRNGATAGFAMPRTSSVTRARLRFGACRSGAAHFADETLRKTGAVEPCFEQQPSTNSIAPRAATPMIGAPAPLPATRCRSMIAADQADELTLNLHAIRSERCASRRPGWPLRAQWTRPCGGTASASLPRHRPVPRRCRRDWRVLVLRMMTVSPSKMPASIIESPLTSSA